MFWRMQLIKKNGRILASGALKKKLILQHIQYWSGAGNNNF
jgi:hypothetical protein